MNPDFTLDDFALCGLTLNAHSFELARGVVKSCEVCGETVNPLADVLRCTRCHFLTHKDCAPYVFHPCLRKEDGTGPEVVPADVPRFCPTPANGEHILTNRKLSKTTLCYVCRSVILDPLFHGIGCKICGVFVHKACSPALPKNCRPISFAAPDDRHWFVPGNIKSNALTSKTCAVCRKTVGKSLTLSDYRCCFCHMNVHAACLSYAPKTCHHGPLGRLVATPAEVAVDAGKYVLRPVPGKLPAVFFVNRRSGNLLGEFILKEIAKTFNIAQICDVFEGFDDVFTFVRAYDDFVAVVCGGDGTVGWVMTELSRRNKHPRVFVIPLGTGNDLAISTGWSGGYNGESVVDILRAIPTAVVDTMDRWCVRAAPADGGERTRFMNNYFSLGLDAAVALKFHEKRQANPEAFNSRAFNKIQYVLSAPSAVFDASPALSGIVRLEVDGRDVALPPVQAVIVMNLPTYGGGNRLFQRITEEESFAGFRDLHYGDGLVEVVGISNVLHLGMVLSQSASPIKIAQGRVVRFTTTAEVPAQVDGEPFVLAPSTVTLSRYEQVRVLTRHVFY